MGVIYRFGRRFDKGVYAPRSTLSISDRIIPSVIGTERWGMEMRLLHDTNSLLLGICRWSTVASDSPG